MATTVKSLLPARKCPMPSTRLLVGSKNMSATLSDSTTLLEAPVARSTENNRLDGSLFCEARRDKVNSKWI